MSLVGYEYPVRLDVCYRIKSILNGLDWLIADSEGSFEKAEHNYKIRIKKKRKECKMLFGRLENRPEEIKNRINYIINLTEERLKEVYLKEKKKSIIMDMQKRKIEFYKDGQSMYS